MPRTMGQHPSCRWHLAVASPLQQSSYGANRRGRIRDGQRTCLQRRRAQFLRDLQTEPTLQLDLRLLVPLGERAEGAELRQAATRVRQNGRRRLLASRLTTAGKEGEEEKPGHVTCNGWMWAISCFSPRAASRRSTFRCRFSQNSGDVPNDLPSRSAISGLTARRSRRSSFIDCRETPAASASAVTDRPYSGTNSSRRISPG